ncbi:phage minor head protein [Devosia sp. SL43]|uniref:phage minor head protein n=1 Tax=Devosia sp. SL43 TaxID=2806348 RepID=UPI001F029B46|nr:phage minor head protein [Devosia sp. SL43]UJW86475.1 minor capsid protein [Devosia sp. SL43]
MGRLPRDLEEKRLRLLGAVRRGAFEGYMRRGRVPDVYEHIAEAVREAKALSPDVSPDTPTSAKPVGRPTTHYVWRTAGDNRVRDGHAARNGQIFAWNDPPEHGHPGREPNCRCWPEPYYGDPAVPDALQAMVSERHVNTDPAVLWASIDTTTRPDGSLAASNVVLNDGTVIDSTFSGTSVERLVNLSDGTIVRIERGPEAQHLSVASPNDAPLLVAQLGRLLFPPPPPLVAQPNPPKCWPLCQRS